MNSYSFNPRPMMIPLAGNPNFAYFGPFPVNSLQYSMPSIPNWPPFYFRLDSRYQFSEDFSKPQQVIINKSPSIVHGGSITNENTSVCTIFDEENERIFEGKLLASHSTKKENSEKDYDSIQEIKTKFENIIDDEAFCMKKLSSFEQIIRPKVETKLEYKVEASDSSEGRLRHCWQVKQETFGDGEDEDDLEEKSDVWEKEKALEVLNKQSVSQEGNQKANLKNQLKEMIEFIIEHFGRIRDIDLTKERMKYQYNPVLARVFEILYAKYSCTYKTRAEVVKYITRKAFATIKNNSKKESDASSREACKALCKRYFQVSSEEILNSGVDIENRERFLQLLFPYQKNSKNKLQDNELISKLMSSREFFEDYCLYVQDLDAILEVDNNRKLNKFLNFVLTCINKEQIESIMTYKRVPWLKAWLDNTKIVARELAFSIQWKGQQTGTKKVQRISNFSSENSTHSSSKIKQPNRFERS